MIFFKSKRERERTAAEEGVRRYGSLQNMDESLERAAKKIRDIKDGGPFDQPNYHGCNACDDIRTPLNRDGYCRDCARQQKPLGNATYTFTDQNGEKDTVMAITLGEAWKKLSEKWATSVETLKTWGIKVEVRNAEPCPECGHSEPNDQDHCQVAGCKCSGNVVRK